MPVVGHEDTSNSTENLLRMSAHPFKLVWDVTNNIHINSIQNLDHFAKSPITTVFFADVTQEIEFYPYFNIPLMYY